MAATALRESGIDRRELRRVAFSSLLGTAMEWYDYFLYGLFAALVFNKLFFPNFDPAVGTILSLLSFGVGFIARPIGAAIFGHLGDKIGRKKTLIVTIAVIGASTGCIGLLPTYDAIGLWAPLLLAALRFVQGLSLGGEWGGAVLMAVEHAPRRQRSFYGSMPQLGSPIGTLASSGVVGLVTLLPKDQFMTWGWRLPFLLSFLMLAIALYIRLRVDESPVFKKLETQKEVVRMPLVELFRRSGGRVAIVVFMSLFASGGFFLMTTFAVNYGTTVLKMASWTLLLATMLGAVIEGILIFVGGMLADRFQPWKIVAWGGAACLVLILPIVSMVGSGNPLLAVAGIALGIGMLGFPYGPIGTLLSQLFSDEYRYSGVAVSYNIAGLIGGFVPSLALVVSTTMHGSVWSIGILLSVIMVMTALGGAVSGSILRRQSSQVVGQRLASER